ncbi:hypothetical protein H6G06_10665 [Anabaena sphaerica FACHB-251]|uniref:Uncharacterized protein n=1 Tax=Anabaena sphaerica FACHB-251 TaxID=2692883 RepID=A0A927A0V7_9NOST|nr:hypothetical protein [Anabaena sphaerica]MBD2293944.1 hypothetical protein [Anabaena sphaerica FACHB-251]
MLTKITTFFGLILILAGISTLPLIDRNDYFISMQVVQIGVTLITHNSKQQSNDD